MPGTPRTDPGCVVRFNQAGDNIWAAAAQVTNNTIFKKVNQTIGLISYSRGGNSASGSGICTIAPNGKRKAGHLT